MDANGALYITGQWEDHGGSWQWLDRIAHYQIDTVSRLANLTGGRIDPAFSTRYLRLEQDDRSFWLMRLENTGVAAVNNADDPGDLAALVDPGTMELVSKIDLVGGDVLTRRARRTTARRNLQASRRGGGRRCIAPRPDAEMRWLGRVHQRRVTGFY